MTQYGIYRHSTGELISSVEAPAGQIPPEGQWEGDIWIIHGACDPNRHRVVRPRNSKKPKLAGKTRRQRRDADFDRRWFDFRAARDLHLQATDKMLAEDFPISAGERERLKERRRASRDIPQTTEDPEEAMSLLNSIWSS